MKILIINDTANVIGGAASVAIQTADLLGKAGNHVVFFAARGPIDNRLASNSNVEVILLDQELCLNDRHKLKGALRGLFNRYAYHQLLQLLHEDKTIQIAHIHSWTKALSSSVFLALKKTGVPTALTVHDYFLACPNGGLFDYQKCKICPLRPMSLRCIIRNCDRRSYAQKLYRVARTGIQSLILRNWMPKNIHVSNFARMVLVKQSKRYDGIIIPNPVMTQAIQYVDCLGNRKFAYVGRVDKEKGVDLFCEAATKIGVEAKVIGTGDQLENLKQKYPQIQFFGWRKQEDIPKLLQDVRCCVFPSRWYEAAPLTPIEIMHSCGIPFIISSSSAARDSIEDNRTGFLFETNNIKSLIEKMEIVLNDSIFNVIVQTIQTRRNANDIQTGKTYIKELTCEYERMVRSDGKHNK